jgi:glycolate oxidase FAD binding subunit
VLLTPGAVAVELVGPEEDVRPPEGMRALAEAPPEPAGRGTLEAGVPPPRLGDLVARLEDAGLGYEARMGVGTCLVAVEVPEDVGRARAWALELGGHAQVVDGPDDLRADPWGPPPPGLELMRRLRDAFDPAGVLNRGMLLWEVP